MSKPTTKQKAQRQRQDEKRKKDIIYAVNIVKFTSILALRNQGWGPTRLARFSEKFDTIFTDINSGLLTFSDIMITVQQETGIDPKEFVIEAK